MVKLDPSTINEWKEILRPFVEFERERQAFLIGALGNNAPEEEDVDMLCLYEYTNKLLIDCLSSRCIISNEVKSKIENALFVPKIIIN